MSFLGLFCQTTACWKWFFSSPGGRWFKYQVADGFASIQFSWLLQLPRPLAFLRVMWLCNFNLCLYFQLASFLFNVLFFLCLIGTFIIQFRTWLNSGWFYLRVLWQQYLERRIPNKVKLWGLNAHILGAIIQLTLANEWVNVRTKIQTSIWSLSATQCFSFYLMYSTYSISVYYIYIRWI